MAYTSNLCSQNARMICSVPLKNQVEIWFDKHYNDRIQFGDNNGKREGIENKVVKSLVEKSIDHLLFYSSSIKNFTFLNHNLNGDRAIRVILQQEMKESRLNVVIEAHCDKLHSYEITVKTAMCTDEFKISDGQYVLEINGNNSSILKYVLKIMVVHVLLISTNRKIAGKG
jgi:mRNA-degrading endonuclease HigB of HigAB toxin-antitoxin module